MSNGWYPAGMRNQGLPGEDEAGHVDIRGAARAASLAGRAGHS
jgi:hypothetical protein